MSYAERVKIMKFKHILVSIVYLLSIFLLVSPGLVGIFARGRAVFILGILLLAALTLFYGMYIYMVTAKTADNKALTATIETPYTKYRDMLEWFGMFKVYGLADRSKATITLNADFANSYKEGVIRNNPFRDTKLGDRIQEVAVDISNKYDQTVSILKESFNPYDLTYQNYISVLDDVLKISSAHLKSIKKRVCVFDYRTWSVDRKDSICVKYLEEVETNVVRLEEIENKFDHLIHELVCLSEISEAPLIEMQSLIETTSDYKSLEEE